MQRLVTTLVPSLVVSLLNAPDSSAEPGVWLFPASTWDASLTWSTTKKWGQ